MVNHSDGTRSPGHLGGNAKPVTGWTKTHSWMFLVIVTVSLAMIGFQNRYHYFAPQGSGNTYRVDKLFGTLQQFDGDRGWVRAELARDLPPEEPVKPRAAAPRIDEPPIGAGMTTQSPGTTPKPDPVRVVEPDLPKPVIPNTGSPRPVPPADPPSRPKEPSREEKLQIFKDTFEDFGEEEFKLAHDDLYPDWKKNVNPSGTWPQFLEVYREFVQWWIDSGAPAEAGVKLWKTFLETKKP